MKMTNGHNGNGHGHSEHGPGGPYGMMRKLKKLLEYHEGIAHALRTTLMVLQDESIGLKRTRSADVLTAALQLDAERITRREQKEKKQQGGAYRKGQYRPGYSTKAAVAERRGRSIQFLAHFDTKEPRPMPAGATAQNSGLGPLINQGYLKKKGDGYVRTKKEYRATP